MTAAPPGAVVSIYYDPDPEADVAVGDGLLTRTGRLYVIVALRRQWRGKHAGRLRLRCAVAEPEAAVARVWPLFWHPRGRASVAHGARAQG
jgi:hypothetical protein